MYNYFVKFMYDGVSLEYEFTNEANFQNIMDETILSNQASAAANYFIDENKLRKQNVFIGDLCLYVKEPMKLLWKKK